MTRKISAIVVSMLIGLSPVFSQSSIRGQNDTLTEEVSYFLFNLMYNTNNSVGQIDQTTNISTTLGDVSFYHKSGAWVSLMPAVYSDALEFSYDVDASAGYQYFFQNGFDVNIYYQYHFYDGDSAFMGIDYQHSLNASAGYTFRRFYLYSDFYSLHGTEVNYFANTGLGYYYNWSIGKTGKWSLSIFPMLSMGMGTDFWLYQQLTSTEKATLISDIGQEGYKTETFDFQSMDVIIPISLSYSNFSVGVSYLYSNTANKYKFAGIENQSGFLFSIDYTFNLK